MARERRWILPTAVAAIGLWSWWGLDLDLGRIERAPSAVRRFLGSMWPPDFDPAGPIQDALIDTVQIAILATILGTLASLPIGMVAARNVFPAWIATPVRTLATAVRVLPAILWALFAVLIFGPGPFAGIVALTFYTIGYLTKLQSEAIEGIPRDALDAVRAMGAPRYQQAWHVAVPEAANALRSQALFMFEYNVRNSSVLGFVAAGGIGVNIVRAYEFSDFDRIAAYLIALFLVVAAIDALSYLVRRRFIEHGETRRPRWRDVVWPARTPGA